MPEGIGYGPGQSIGDPTLRQLWTQYGTDWRKMPDAAKKQFLHRFRDVGGSPSDWAKMLARWRMNIDPGDFELFSEVWNPKEAIRALDDYDKVNATRETAASSPAEAELQARPSGLSLGELLIPSAFAGDGAGSGPVPPPSTATTPAPPPATPSPGVALRPGSDQGLFGGSVVPPVVPAPVAQPAPAGPIGSDQGLYGSLNFPSEAAPAAVPAAAAGSGFPPGTVTSGAGGTTPGGQLPPLEGPALTDIGPQESVTAEKVNFFDGFLEALGTGGALRTLAQFFKPVYPGQSPIGGILETAGTEVIRKEASDASTAAGKAKMALELAQLGINRQQADAMTENAKKGWVPSEGFKGVDHPAAQLLYSMRNEDGRIPVPIVRSVLDSINDRSRAATDAITNIVINSIAETYPGVHADREEQERWDDKMFRIGGSMLALGGAQETAQGIVDSFSYAPRALPGGGGGGGEMTPERLQQIAAELQRRGSLGAGQ